MLRAVHGYVLEHYFKSGDQGSPETEDEGRIIFQVGLHIMLSPASTTTKSPTGTHTKQELLGKSLPESDMLISDQKVKNTSKH